MSEGDSVDAMQERAHAALETVADSFRCLGLRLAAKRTQVVVLTRCYGVVSILVFLFGEAVRLGACMNYLDIVFEHAPSGRGCFRKFDAKHQRSEQ